MTGAAAAVGVLLGFGGAKVIKIALLLGAVGGAAAMLAKKYV